MGIDEIVESKEDMEKGREKIERNHVNTAKVESKDFDPLVKEFAEPSFPSGCSWECYLANHPRVSKEIEHTKEAALNHYLKYGNKKKGRRDCTCHEGTPVKGQTNSKPSDKILGAAGDNSERNKKKNQEKNKKKNQEKNKKKNQKGGTGNLEREEKTKK